MLGFDFDVTGTETVRQTGQVFLEKLRSDDQQHSSQQGATPFDLASDIARLALKYHPGREVSFLEPCIGSGIFFSALLHDAAEKTAELAIRSAHGVEQDEHFAALAHDLWAPAGLTISDVDFMRLTADHLPKATLVLSRPPATQHHRLSSDEKIRSADAAETASGIRPTGLADLYNHFVLATHKFLAPGAVSAWLLPSAFLHRHAGHALRWYLTNRVRIQRIHSFDRGILDATAHEDEILDWSVLIFTNERPQPSNTFEMSDGGELFNATVTKEVPYSRLDPASSWQDVLRDDGNQQVSYRMDDFFEIRHGWDVPGKKYLVLNEDKAWALGIQPYHMHPMLPPPAEVTEKVVEADDWEYPVAENRRVIIASRYDSSYLEDKDPALLQYLNTADAETIAAAKQSENNLWYNLHVRGATPILVQPATEQDTGPYRFIINTSQGVAGPGWITMSPKLAFAKPQLILDGIDWDAVQFALDNIRLPDATQNPPFTPEALASLDATVIAEYLGLTDQRA